MKTKFINGTSSEITLKEANSGIQRFLFKLGRRDGPSTSSYTMELDTNATYREYHLFVIPSCSAGSIIVSSDHLVDHKVITITEVESGVFAWEGTPRKCKAVTKKAESEEACSSSEGQAGASSKLARWVSRGISFIMP
ncbi:hypothetical protein M758_2G068600 [Ceratodon purpureus]|nr:hypothetical protein M758_2G068600 [Ceratodon purpureus]